MTQNWNAIEKQCKFHKVNFDHSNPNTVLELEYLFKKIKFLHSESQSSKEKKNDKNKKCQFFHFFQYRAPLSYIKTHVFVFLDMYTYF